MRTLTYPVLVEELAASALPVLVQFSAEWCGPCHAMEPIVAEIALEMVGRIAVWSIDGDESPQATVDHRVMAFPTLILFCDGREVRRWIGARGKRQLLAELEDVLSLSLGA